MKRKFYWQIFEKSSNIKFHRNPSSGSGVVPYGRRDTQKDMMELIVAFRKFAEAPKNGHFNHSENVKSDFTLSSVLSHCRTLRDCATRVLGPVHFRVFTILCHRDLYGIALIHFMSCLSIPAIHEVLYQCTYELLHHYTDTHTHTHRNWFQEFRVLCILFFHFNLLTTASPPGPLHPDDDGTRIFRNIGVIMTIIILIIYWVVRVVRICM